MAAVQTEGRVTDQTLRLHEYELRLAVAQYLRSRGVHATADIVRFGQAGGTVADIAVRTGRRPPNGPGTPPEP